MKSALAVVPIDDVERMEAEDRAKKRAFAAAYALGTPPMQAIRLAHYDRPTKTIVARLLADPFVQAEIEKHFTILQNELFQKRELILAQLDDDRFFAYEQENPAAAVAATVAKAKILGMLDRTSEKNMPSKITVEWGEESKETIYEKSNPLIHGALEQAVGNG